MSRQVTLLSTRETIHLRTNPVCPPVPIRCWDWSAIDENTYDADYDEERGYYSNSPYGMGEHEIDAINDLFDQLEAA